MLLQIRILQNWYKGTKNIRNVHFIYTTYIANNKKLNRLSMFNLDSSKKKNVVGLVWSEYGAGFQTIRPVDLVCLHRPGFSFIKQIMSAFMLFLDLKSLKSSTHDFYFIFKFTLYYVEQYGQCEGKRLKKRRKGCGLGGEGTVH